MDVEITEKDGSYLVQVVADERIAIVINSSSGERIYLPGSSGDLSYYKDDATYLDENSGVWSVEHHEKPESIDVIS